MARLSVSALLFDYVLTGPISSVSAGQYLGRLINETSGLMGSSFALSPNQFAVFFAVIVTIYFWWYNIKGLHESSTKALRIMQVTTVMVVIFLVWCSITLIVRGPAQIPPAPVARNLEFSEEGLGWFKGTMWPTIPVVAIIIAFGHSLLSMSGFETLAQVYREIASPKLKNLRITGNIVCMYAAISTGDHHAAGGDDHSGRASGKLRREPSRRTRHASRPVQNCCVWCFTSLWCLSAC